MNEKERYEEVRAVLSLSILPAIKEVTRKTNTLYLLNLVGNVLLLILVSVSIALILIQGV
jgi:hypothetical protein